MKSINEMNEASTKESKAIENVIDAWRKFSKVMTKSLDSVDDTSSAYIDLQVAEEAINDAIMRLPK